MNPTRCFCAALALACATIIAGCSGGTQAKSTLSDSTFVEIMFELTKLKNQPDADTVYLARQRQQVLERHKVSVEDLEKKSLIIAEDPARATRIWDEVRRRIGPG